MDYRNQPQGAPVGGQQDQGQAPGQQAPGRDAQINGGFQATQPQAGGFYQFQPGVGFVQVQGSAMQAGMDAATNMDAQAAAQQAAAQQSAADAAAQAGMFGQQAPEGTEPKFNQQKLGKMYSAVTDIMNGEADPASLIGLFAENSGDFWKGALVGAAAVVLINNEAVKGALGGLAGSVGAMFGDQDPEGEQVTVGGK